MVQEMLHHAGFSIVHTEVLPDDQKIIEQQLRQLADESCLDLVVTTGDTGVSPQDVTPDAPLVVIQRQVPVNGVRPLTDHPAPPRSILAKAS